MLQPLKVLELEHQITLHKLKTDLSFFFSYPLCGLLPERGHKAWSTLWLITRDCRTFSALLGPVQMLSCSGNKSFKTTNHQELSNTLVPGVCGILLLV